MPKTKIALPVAFLPARAKLCIGSLDDPKLEVRAQYNPKELQLDKQVPWGDHKARSGKRPKNEPSEQSDLEFNGAPKRSMTVELLFDTYEQGGASVDADLRLLEQLSEVVDPKRSRPHHCVVTWGDSRSGMRPFRCVIESLAVKYTVWDHGGTPKRATCTVKLKESLHMAGAGEAPEKYGEKRRWTGSQEGRPKDLDGRPADLDRLGDGDYMEQLAGDLNRKKEEETPPAGPRTGSCRPGT